MSKFSMCLILFKSYSQEYHKQGSVLRPISCNIFLNDLAAVLKKPQLYNFADDNTISTTADNTDELLKIFREELESAVK